METSADEQPSLAVLVQRAGGGLHFRSGPAIQAARSAMVEARRPFAHFPASESVVTADSWAGRREDRWGFTGTSGGRLIQ